MIINEQIPKSYSLPDECKFCGSRQIVRYGSYKNIQRWLCKQCKRKFADNSAPPKMRTPAIQIASALSMFYEGMSLNTIRRHLEQTFHNLPSDSTVHGWITRFTSMAVSADWPRSVQPAKIIDKLGHGPFWIANAVPLRIAEGNVWLWDIIDYWNRMLVASRISSNRTAQDVKAVMELAARRTGEPPGLVITNKLSIFKDGIELAFGTDTHHLQAASPKIQPYTNTIDRFHGPLKTRNRIMRGLKKREAAELIMDGWLVHYNFFRPHEALKYSTPASIAKIEFPYRNWLDVVERGYCNYHR